MKQRTVTADCNYAFSLLRYQRRIRVMISGRERIISTFLKITYFAFVFQIFFNARSLFDLDLEGKVCMDIGASTGGFTDCMLQKGAAKVSPVSFPHCFSNTLRIRPGAVLCFFHQIRQILDIAFRSRDR